MRFKVLVKEVMNKEIKTVDLDDSIERAAEVMKNSRIGSVLVMGEKNLKGILTTRDIVYKHVAGSRGEFVKDIMSTDIISISPDKTIEDAAKLMAENEIEKLPVFDKGTLVGIITSNDVLRIEPALFEILLEKMKIGGGVEQGKSDLGECESCGNYSDELEEENGVYICPECRKSV
ncbi:MAG TPA: CBS domain-containing protein [archaeon]|nr:CBS domain-containing protein [archaeon]